VLVGANLSVKSLNLDSCECNEELSRNISICRCLNPTDELTTHSCPVLRASEMCTLFTLVQNADALSKG
jgi:hypothetical protein